MHRFGPARTWWLVLEGRRYDSKAIAGVAFGYQFPERGALTASQFSGGEQSVKAVLEALGFELVVDIAPEQIARWIQQLRTSPMGGGRPAPHKPLLLLLAL